MADDNLDVKPEGDGTPDASPAPKETSPESNEAPASAAESVISDEKKGDDKRQVDPERLNSLIADSKELKELKTTVARSEEVTQSRLKAAADALTGSQGTATKSEMDTLAEEYNVPIDYLKKQNTLLAKLVKEELKAELAPLKQGQEEMKYQKQVNSLVDKFPEVTSLSVEEKVELKKMAYQKEYINAPLDAVYARFVMDRPGGRPKTFESGRGGPRGGDTEKSITDMTDAEFMEYSKALETRNK